MYAAAEGLVELDLRLQEWRNRHILLVYRVIGVGTPLAQGQALRALGEGGRRSFSRPVAGAR